MNNDNKINEPNIALFKYFISWTTLTVPTVYTCAMSYYETLGKLIPELNNLRNNQDITSDNYSIIAQELPPIIKEQQEYLETFGNKIRPEWDNWYINQVVNMNNFKIEFNNQFKGYQEELNTLKANALKSLENWYTQKNNIINTTYDKTNTDFDTRAKNLLDLIKTQGDSYSKTLSISLDNLLNFYNELINMIDKFSKDFATLITNMVSASKLKGDELEARLKDIPQKIVESTDLTPYIKEYVKNNPNIVPSETSFFTYIKFVGNDDPTNASDGDLFLSTNNNQLYEYRGSWQKLDGDNRIYIDSNRHIYYYQIIREQFTTLDIKNPHYLGVIEGICYIYDSDIYTIYEVDINTLSIVNSYVIENKNYSDLLEKYQSPNPRQVNYHDHVPMIYKTANLFMMNVRENTNEHIVNIYAGHTVQELFSNKRFNIRTLTEDPYNPEITYNGLTELPTNYIIHTGMKYFTDVIPLIDINAEQENQYKFMKIVQNGGTTDNPHYMVKYFGGSAGNELICTAYNKDYIEKLDNGMLVRRNNLIVYDEIGINNNPPTDIDVVQWEAVNLNVPFYGAKNNGYNEIDYTWLLNNSKITSRYGQNTWGFLTYNNILCTREELGTNSYKYAYVHMPSGIYKSVLSNEHYLIMDVWGDFIIHDGTGVNRDKVVIDTINLELKEINYEHV